MAEASKIRLVRCPKCGDLLPELSEYSVYQCGGCGAVLRAKKKLSTNDGFLENSNKVKDVKASLSETQRDSDRVEVCSEKDRDLVHGNVDLVSVSSSRTEKEEFSVGNDDVIVGEKTKGLRLGQNNFKREIKYVDGCRQSSKHPIEVQVGGDDHDMNLNRYKSGNSSAEKGIGEVSAQFGNSANQGVEREGFRGFDGDFREDAGRSRFSRFAGSDEGSSNYKPKSFYRNGKPTKNWGYREGPSGVESLELNKAELNRKLHNLKEQISRLEGKPRENTLDDRKRVPSESYREPAAYNVPMQPFPGTNHAARPPDFNCGHRTAPFMNEHNLDMHNFYPPPRHAPHMMPRSNYEDPLWSQMPRRPHNQPPPQYRQPPPLDYYLGQYMDFNQDLPASYPQEPFLHQSARSCLHCRNKNWHVLSEVIETGFSSGSLPQSNFYHCTNPNDFRPKNHVPIRAIAPLHSQDLQLHTRWPSDIDSYVGAFYQGRPRRVVVAHGNRQICRPIAGGAPFMLCHNCLELLKLPRKVMKMTNNLPKLQCGSCSTSYSFEIENKRLIISVPTETQKISCEADDVSHDPSNGGVVRSHVCSSAGGTNSYFVDFDSGYNFHSADNKQNFLLKSQTSNLNESEKEEKSRGSVIIEKDVSNSAERPSKDDTAPTVAGSTFDMHFDDSASIHAVTGSGIGNRSKRTDEEKVIVTKIGSQQNAEKDVSMETEVEVSFSDYLNTNLSHDSIEVSKEDAPRINKGHKTFLVGLIKKSFGDFSRSTRSTENGRPNVFVNGQRIPDRLIKKAEKHAGPIEPGDYWYDSRAGFWGVMGQPCHGIITPYIEEFNYPMPENCAAGNTSVFVNGRELHQNDLDLLCSRGLPTTKNKKYIIEISGRVLDEDSGEELDCLLKLAPTVENIKRGFGMRVPKVTL